MPTLTSRIPSRRRCVSPAPRSRLAAFSWVFLAIGGLCLLLPGASQAAQEFVITIQTTVADTTETFWLQIPEGYHPGLARPLLIGWHQLGGDHLELKEATDFDSIADARGWIAASPLGAPQSHWTNQSTQSHVVDVIRWIEDRYSVDPSRIYMVGASMGGAAGMVFSNNHLDPKGPRIAAVASLSGIQDCERRFHEQGINSSMIEAFGGSPEEVPFEYHRNSAIVFPDSTESMHGNARHLPLYLTFGRGVTDSIWRVHAEDLYARMVPFADRVVLRESGFAGHGWSCVEETRICDFFEAQTLNSAPRRISVNADEEGRWYWADLRMRVPGDRFARLEATASPATAHLDLDMIRNVAAASVELGPLGFPLNESSFTCRWRVVDAGPSELVFLGVTQAPATVTRDGSPYSDWSYDPGNGALHILGSGSALYQVWPEAASVIGPDGSTPPPPALSPEPSLEAWWRPGEGVRYRAPGAGRVEWELFEITGRRLSQGATNERAGLLPLERPGPSGMYFIRILWTAAQATKAPPSTVRIKIPVVH